MEPIIRERLGRLCERLEQALTTGEVVSLDIAFAALTADVITQRFYGEHFDYLGSPDFTTPISQALQSISSFMNFALPNLIFLVRRLPITIIRAFQRPLSDFLVSPESDEREDFILSTSTENLRKRANAVICT